jgi:5-(hydroxymethyl)furfural/furfural oxidase
VGHVAWDVIVVGAGSAGCVMANRLSAGGARVLLVEAGADTPPDAVPADIADLYPRSYYNGRYMWSGLQADQAGDGTGARSAFPQARVMGGGSSLMGMIALRGLPADYDGWAARGLPGWSWQDVLSSFTALEHDRDFGGQLHGDAGPISIRRHLPEDWPPFCRAVGTAAREAGFAAVEDFNADPGDGYGALPMSSTLSGRVSSASAFLDADVRRRPGLVVRCRTEVLRLHMEGTRCAGVVLAGEHGTTEVVRAGSTVVSGGAVFSPTLLLRSGLGPAEALRRLGIDVVADLPGVGENLQNHPVAYLACFLRPEGRQSPSLRPGFNTGLRFTSGLVPGVTGDLQMLVLNKSSWHGLGSAVAGLGVCLVGPASRGRVRLVDRAGLPEVDFRFLSEQVDRERMEHGFGVAAELMRSPAVAAVRHEVFAAGYSRVVRRLNEPGRVNVATTRVLAGLLDGPRPLRRGMLRWGIASGSLRESRLTDRGWLTATARARSFGTYHPAGTCAMGPDSDPMAVVDGDGRVRGVEGLRVVDASVMPTVPRANTNLPVQMVAEHLARRMVAAGG